ncbi:MAG: polysaccharide deacetylase family protein [Casimicrobiaceae bacterium]
MKIPIICYHSCHAGDDYATDDHTAVATDLRIVHRLGFRIVPVDWVVESVLGERALPPRCVALTCDDGVDLDWHDVDHPTFGWRQSFAGILRDFATEVGDDQPHVEMTSFVVASPDARKELEVNCLASHPWWTDDWWRDADLSGMLRIENHSWDHVHPGVTRVAQRDQRKGDFGLVASFDDCEMQIGKASAFIASKTGRRPKYFAYPYGQSSNYLRETYFPVYGAHHGIRAAFSIDHAYVTEDSNRWCLPRFTHGTSDFLTTEDFERILLQSQ